ncbi:glycosyltransferase family 2 protein [Puia sp.]|uniref:glycosyltransferase n=1 Tax=Puia sp. TaxID=2045100 RepID=UPI002F423C0D
MSFLEKIAYLFYLLLFALLTFSVLYLFILSFAGRVRRIKPARISATPKNDIAIMVAAYKEDGIIVSTARNLLTLDYPAGLYTVYILADSFRPETLQELRRLPVEVIEVLFEKSTKAKSLNAAFSRIDRKHDIVLICDADNILEKDFLRKLDGEFSAGERAVQGQRVAKNLDSPFAILDACSEAIGNHLFRRGSNALGLSSSVIGSGMAFDFSEMRQIMSEIDATGGFDKILQLKVVERGHSIRYLHDGAIYDEKIGNSTAFSNQRKRWVSSQHQYLKKYFLPSFRQLFRGNFNYFNLGILHNFVPPRSFLFVLMPLLVVMSFFVHPMLYWVIASGTLLVLFVLSMMMGVPSELVNRDLFRAMLRLPRAVFIMFGTLLHLKKANKTFIHTVHTKTEVSNPALKNTTNP